VLVVAVAAAAVLGALAGVLAPRPAYRLAVPYGAPPRTACEACGTPVTWVGLGGCARCGARLGPRTWAMGLFGTVSFAAVSWALWPAAPVLPAALAVAGAGLVLAPIDVAVLRLPDRLVGAAFTAAACSLIVAAAGTGAYGALLRAGLAGAAMAGGYLLLALLPGGPVGLGDVKLAGVLGLVLGWLGWDYVLAGAVLPHLVNGPVVLALLATGRVRRDSALPFGPALLAGALLAVVVVRLL
jgi:leader peptidase (prepilin peptidase)/N-methyltransferase